MLIPIHCIVGIIVGGGMSLTETLLVVSIAGVVADVEH